MEKIKSISNIHIHFINFNDHPQEKKKCRKLHLGLKSVGVGTFANTNQFMVVFKAVIDQF